MKAIILNSGKGSRLKDLTKDKPKSMVSISENETIFSKAIKILSQFPIDEFIITTGYLNNVLKDYISSNFPDLNFKFIHNPEYNSTNYIKSINYIPDDFDDDIILLHGDLIFDYEVADKILNNENSCVVVDSSLEIPEKDFKARVENNSVKMISVKIFTDDVVACQPFYKIKNDDWKLWKENIRKYCDNGNDNVYAEEALNELTDTLFIEALDMKGYFCSEVDTVEDLERVKEIID